MDALPRIHGVSPSFVVLGVQYLAGVCRWIMLSVLGFEQLEANGTSVFLGSVVPFNRVNSWDYRWTVDSTNILMKLSQPARLVTVHSCNVAGLILRPFLIQGLIRKTSATSNI